MDVILRGGQVIDGTGALAFRADVGVEGDTIVAIGDLAVAPAAMSVDVAGLTVAPGFIDMHSHSDLTLPVDHTADSKVCQGVTTEVVGQCGMSAAPAAVNTKSEFDRYWSEMSSYRLGQPDMCWSSFGGYLQAVSDRGLAINIVPLVGHGAIRTAVMGTSREAPPDEELCTMQQLVAAAMNDGAWGMSTGLIYAPGIYSRTEELVALARVVADSGGFYFSHLRDEGERLLEAIQEALTIGRSAGLPVQLSHFKVKGRRHWAKMGPALSLVDRAQAEGLDVMADIYPYCASSTGLPSMVLPPWARSGGLAGGATGVLRRPLDREVRSRLAHEIEAGMEADGRRWDELYVARCPDRPDYEGMTIQQLAGQKGQEPVDTVLSILEETHGRVSAIMTAMSEENVQMGLTHPSLMIGTDGNSLKPSGLLGVGKLHPRSYGTFPRVLGRYARELGIMTIEQAVHKMTGLGAERLGLRDRGRLAVGLKADITVFNPDTVIDTATYADPYRYPIGIEHVLVNGRMVVTDGKFAGHLAGKVLMR